MMLMTPADSIEILIGKAVMPTLIACGQAFLIFAIGFLWFELPFKGSFLLLGLVIFGFSLCMVAWVWVSRPLRTTSNSRSS